MTIGERIKELRNALGISQRKLALDLNVAETSIQRYENNSSLPDREILLMMADYFCVSTDYLLGVKGLKKQSEERYGIL